MIKKFTNAILCLLLVNLLAPSSISLLHYKSLKQNIKKNKSFLATKCELSDEKDIKPIKRIRGRVSYNGSGFHGWQVQPKDRTVQGEIEGALSRRLNREVKIVGASRTDSGVHGKGQAFHFDFMQNNEVEDLEALESSLNSMLGKDIRIWSLSIAPVQMKLPWHSIISAEKKLYSYRISTKSALNPLERFSRAHIHTPIDVEVLGRILTHFQGTHDFRAFSGAIEANERKKNTNETNTVRTIYSIDLVVEELDPDEPDKGLFRIDILLNGALYKMIRNILGAAFEASILPQARKVHSKRASMTENLLLYLLNQSSSDTLTRDDNPSKPAPPEGLTLEWVYYDDNYF